MPISITDAVTGREYEFPDGATSDQIRAAMAKERASAPRPNPTDAAGVGPESSSLGRVKALGTGLGKGAIAATAGLPGDLVDLGQTVGNYVAPGLVSPPTGTGTLPRSKEIYNWLDERGLIHKPVDATERYLEAIGAGVGGFVNPVGKVVSGAPLLSKGAAVLGGIMGVGGETGAALSKDYPDLGRFAGSAIPGAVGLWLAAKKPNIVGSTQDLLQELGVKGLREADATAKAAAATTGVPVALPQGTSRSTAMSGIVKELLGSPEGVPLQNIFTKQLDAMPSLVRRIPEGMGPTTGAQVDANMVLGAGKTALREKEKARLALAKPHYDAAFSDTVDPKPIVAAILKGRQEASIPAAVSEGKSMKTLQEMIDSAAGQQVPVLELNTVARKAEDAAKKAFDAGNSIKGKANQIVANAINETIKQPGVSPNLVKADQVFKAASESLVDPMKQGAFGQFFPQKMLAGKVGEMSHFVKQLDSSDPAEVATVAAYLRRANPQAFPAIVKDSFMKKAEASLKARKGRDSIDAFTDFANKVAGRRGSSTREAFNVKVGQAALAMGKDDQAAVNAANELVDAMYVLNREHVGSVGAAGFREEAGANAAAAAAQSFGLFYPIRRAGRSFEHSIYSDTYSAVAKAFTTPDGVDKLIEISKFANKTHKAQAFWRALVGVSAQAQADE